MDGGQISFAPVTTDHKNEGGGREEKSKRRERRGEISASPGEREKKRKRKEEEEEEIGREKRRCYSLVWISFGQGTERVREAEGDRESETELKGRGRLKKVCGKNKEMNKEQKRTSAVFELQQTKRQSNR